MLTYKYIVFDYGYDADPLKTPYGDFGQGFQEVRDGRETRLLTLAGEEIVFAKGQGYGYAILHHDVHPEWATEALAAEQVAEQAVLDEAKKRQFDAAVEQMMARLQEEDGNSVLKAAVDQSVAEALVVAKAADLAVVKG